MVVNAAQLATYSQAKQVILASKKIKDGIFCHFCASMISGLATTICSMPVDIIKTRLVFNIAIYIINKNINNILRIQNMRIINGKPEYNGVGDVLRQVIRNEGFFALWKGFTPYYMRLGPHTVITFIILEQITSLYYKIVLGVSPTNKTM